MVALPPDLTRYQSCIYELEQDGHRIRIEAPTAEELVRLVRELEME
jgi:hypothetical protein